MTWTVNFMASCIRVIGTGAFSARRLRGLVGSSSRCSDGELIGGDVTVTFNDFLRSTTCVTVLCNLP